MLIKKVRDKHRDDVFLNMGEKAFFDNEYAVMPPRSYVPGIENIYDRNAFHDMRLVREMCQKIDGQPITQLGNPSAEDMRYAFADGKKPPYPSKPVAEEWLALQKKQQYIDLTEGHKEMGNYLREIHTAGDIDLANRSLLQNGQAMDPSSLAVLNNPLLNGGYIKIPNISEKSMNATLGDLVNDAVKKTTGVDTQAVRNDVNQALGLLDKL